MTDSSDRTRAGLVSVRGALTVPSLQGARVVAGESGLDRMVTSVTVGEVPDIAGWLSGGELVVSTLYAVAGDPDARLAFVERLMEREAAGLLTKPGRFVGGLDQAIVDAAQAHDFPVVVVDEDIRWTDVVQEVYGLALGQHMAELERSLGVQRELVAVGAEGGSFERLVETVFKILGRPVGMQDDQGRWLATYPVEERPALASRQDLIDAIGREELLVFGPEDSASGRLGSATAPIIVGGAVLGAIGASTDGALTELDESALAYAATVGAILIGREQVRLETELRIRGDFLAEVQASRPDQISDLIGKAALLGADLSTGLAMIAVRIDAAATGGIGVSELERSLSGYIIGQHRNTLVATRAADVLAFLGAPRSGDTDEFVAQCGRVAQRLSMHLRSAWPGGTHAVALGRFHRPQTMREALRETEVTLEVAAGLGRSDRVVSFGDVGSFRLLLTLVEHDPAELEAFVADTIGPLATKSPDLLATLESYIDTNGNINEVASKMFMHRHTVRYRLDRITQLTGLDPRTSEGRERLGLGLKATTLLRKIGR